MPIVVRARVHRACLALLLCLSAAPSVAAEEEDYMPKRWQESEVSMPAPPARERLQPFYVSATTENRFMLDPETISVGSDGVVRYVLVVESAAGARNVSYEGIRCESAERRLYAFGRADGSWSPARGKLWLPIQGNSLNRQHAALYTEYFCPNGAIVRNADEARAALRAGGHPDTIQR